MKWSKRKEQAYRKEKIPADRRKRHAVDMGHDSEGGGEEKPGQGMDEKKGSAHDFCRIWEWDGVFLSYPCAGHLTSLGSASEVTRRPLRTAAHMQKALVHWE